MRMIVLIDVRVSMSVIKSSERKRSCCPFLGPNCSWSRLIVVSILIICSISSMARLIFGIPSPNGTQKSKNQEGQQSQDHIDATLFLSNAISTRKGRLNTQGRNG